MEVPIEALRRAVRVSRGRVAPIDIATGLAAALALWMAARLFWTILTPVTPLGDWKPAEPAALPAASARALLAGYDPFYPDASGEAGNGTVTSLPFTLFGIRMNQSAGGGAAIIAGADGVQTSYAVGEEIAPGVRLGAVAFDHVVIDRNGAREMLYLDQSVPAQNVGSAAPPPAPAPMAGLDAAAIGRAVTFAPNGDPAVPGVAVAPRDDGALLRAAGLKPGDVITAVNGRPVTSPADLAQAIRPGARLSLDVRRDGQTVPVALNLGGN